jgi:hypothetical protein
MTRTFSGIAVLLALVMTVLGCGKPNITPECTMNGLGQGSCSFTNKGTAAGAVCGRIGVNDLWGSAKSGAELSVEFSAPFCSGEVAQMTTTKVDFSVPAMRTLCKSTNRGSWSDVCQFEFLADGSAAGAAWDRVAAKAMTKSVAKPPPGEGSRKLTMDEVKEEQAKVDALLSQLASAKDDATRLAIQKQLQDEQAKQQDEMGRDGWPKKKCTPGDPLCSDD